MGFSLDVHPARAAPGAGSCRPGTAAPALNVTLQRLMLHVTRRCNLRCRMCDYRVLHFTEKDLTLEQIQGLLADAVAMGVHELNLSGGEPMMRRDIYDLIAFGKSCGLKVAMMTNATLIGEAEVERLLDAGLATVVVSVEGPRELHDALRGPGTYDRTLTAIRAFVRRRDQVSVKVGTVISRRSFRHLAELTRFLFEDVGIHAISYSPFTRWLLHPTRHDAIGDLEIPEELLPELNAELQRVIAYSRRAPGILPSASFLDKVPDYFAGRSMVPERPCTAPLTSCSVEAGGTLYPCMMIPAAAGNVKERRLQELVQDRAYQATCRLALERRCQGCLSACYDLIHAGARAAGASERGAGGRP